VDPMVMILSLSLFWSKLHNSITHTDIVSPVKPQKGGYKNK
jgi:hypothetical protein